MFNEIKIKFILNPKNGDVMVNATNMAKAFNRRIDFFLKSEETQKFISAMKNLPKDENLWSEFTPTGGNWGIKPVQNDGQFPPNGGNSNPFFMSDEDILQTKGHQGTYMHRLLAMKFAAWLDAEFELWVYITIDNILFGNYRKHWEAHAEQEEVKSLAEAIKNKLLLKGGTPEEMAQYFEYLEISKAAGNKKSNAIRGQLRMLDIFSEQ